MRILLDTCTFLWVVTDAHELFDHHLVILTPDDLVNQYQVRTMW
jgi:PIN domain nuclease of toxin-antitoxin system